MSDDRFATSWGGPYDPRALKWASEHGISYEGPNSTIMELSPGIFVSSGSSFSAFDWDFFRAENQKCDDEVRARHAADTELHTGTSGISDSVNLAQQTRGEKLREYKIWVDTYEKTLTEAQDRRRILASRINVNSQATNSYDQKYLSLLIEYIPFLEVLVERSKHLQALVQRETEAGWDWKVGIPEQKAVKYELRMANDRVREFVIDARLSRRMHETERVFYTTREWKEVLGVDLPEGTLILDKNWPMGLAIGEYVN